jgi:DNA polymerase-4
MYKICVYSAMSYDLTRNVHRITLYNTIAGAQQHRSSRPRLYLHLDLNCFYAQVEQKSYNLYGIPLIIGGWRKENGIPRGICATSSYEARKLGIKTAMSALEAQQICPFVVMLRVHYEKYQAVSRQLVDILDRFSPDIESYSMDEFFMDISFLLKRSPEEIAYFGSRLKNEVYRQTGLVCSVGISYSKTYAKLASDLHKPNGLTMVLNEDQAREQLWPLPLKEVWGIGSRRFAKLQAQHVYTIEDAVRRGPGVFQRLFGNYFGKMLFETVTGKDRAMVLTEQGNHIPKEVAYMHTFSDWTVDPQRVEGEIASAVRTLCYRMRGYGRRARLFVGYIRFQDVTWKGISFRFTTPGMTNLDDYVLQACLETARPLVMRFLSEGHRIRGVGINTMEMDGSRQLEIFFREDERLSNLCFAIDHINNRYGIHTLLRGADHHKVEGNTHFLERN